MAISSIPLPILGCRFDATNPPGLAFTNDRPKLMFDDTTDQLIYWTFLLPQSYSNLVAPVLKVFYSMAGANVTKAVVWAAEIMAVSDGDAVDMDVDSYDAINTVVKACPDVAGRPDLATLTLTNRDSAWARDFFAIKFRRDPTDVGDTAAGDAELWAINMEYTLS